ncbi:hypothetical protein LSG31_08055 [Fodinisporobacter ferrooxydans]|uniref:DUF4025 domain-containing protein n=1 Tax=Fodinisporobacter ferrooxydans TaxID=2901836 RepID=A0ABY4CRU0_9BACL|nr:hypothetical protein LSG31_08055 [Alicyclobacillaceae bacterium MYW30-H2]
MKQKQNQSNANAGKQSQSLQQTTDQVLNEVYNYPSFTNTVDGFDEESTLFTHMQIHDSYREGTIDAHIEQSKNDRKAIPQTPNDLT